MSKTTKTNPRELNDHKELSGLNNELTVTCLDEPMPPSMACHVYQIDVGEKVADTTIHFQKGAVKEYGLNGITNEALISIVLDRFKGFQTGKFACEDNAKSIEHLEAVLAIAKSRTAKRTAAGVEGQDKHVGQG